MTSFNSGTVLFSVLMPTYNRGRFINTAVASVLSQLKDCEEVIVVDDGSTDNTSEIMGNYKTDGRIRYIVKEHSNAPDTRNRAVAEAKHPWLLWLDSDDILAPDAVFHYKSLMSAFPDVDVLYGNLEPFGMLRDNEQQRMVFRDYYHKREMLLQDLFFDNRIPNPGVLVKKEIYRTYGGYNIQFNRLHDYEFWIRTAPHINVKHCRKTVCKWRWHQENMSSGSVVTDKKYNRMIVDKYLETYGMDAPFPFYKVLKDPKTRAFCYLQIGKQYARASADADAAEKAFWYFSKSIDLRPFHETYFELLQMISLQPEDQKMAFSRRTAPQRLEKAHGIVQKMMGRGCAVKYKIASLNKRLGYWEAAESRFLELIRRLKGKKHYSSFSAGAYFHLGELLLKRGDVIAALNYFDQCLSLNPYHQKAREYKEKFQ